MQYELRHGISQRNLWPAGSSFEQISVPLARANIIGIIINDKVFGAGYPIVLFYEIDFVRAIGSLTQ